MQTKVGNAWEIPHTPPGRVAEVATAELEAELVLLGTLEGRDWRRPTDCAGWDVHDLTAHLACEYEEIFRPVDVVCSAPVANTHMTLPTRLVV
jgi:hypothetical protein